MRTIITIAFLLFNLPAFAQDAKSIETLAFGESDDKVEAIAALVAAGTPKAAEILQALADGELVTSGKRVLLVKGDTAVDAVTGEKLAAVPEDKDDIIVNNRLRRELGGALAALKLVSPDRGARLAAVKELVGSAEAGMLPLVQKALAGETDPAIKGLLEQVAAGLELRAEDRSLRLSAAKKLGASSNPS
ncbi:MAG: urea ABC transporter permease subunit UrtB, partial [Clostridia bacterium]